jgi:hypothetical protein
MFKDFEDFWKNSGILDTDSYRCIAETYEFTKDNIPQAFESFGRNCYTFGMSESFDLGKRYGRGDMIETMLTFLDMLKTADDISVVRKMIDTISKRYAAKIEEDENGFPVEKKT